MSFHKTHIVALAGMLVIAVAGLGFAGGAEEQVDVEETLTFMHFHAPGTDEAAATAFHESLERFRENHPEIEIDDEFIPGDDMDTVFRTRSAGGDLADLYIAAERDFPTLWENDQIAPLTELLDDEYIDLYPEGMLDNFYHDDELWAIGQTADHNHIIFYNEEILEEAGWNSFPDTMSEFFEMSEDIRDAGYTPMSFGNMAGWPGVALHLDTLVYRFADGEWFDSVFNDTGGTFLDEPFIRGAQLLKDMVDEGVFNEDFASIDNEEQRLAFYDGEAAMFAEGRWAVSAVIDGAPRDIVESTELAIYPGVEGYEQYSNVVPGGASALGVAVNNDLDDNEFEAAKTFIQNVFDQDFGDRMLELGEVPAISTTIDVSEVDVPRLQREYYEMVDEVRYAPISNVRYSQAVVDALEVELQELLLGNISVEEYAQLVEEARQETMVD